ncbi:OB-fold protein [Snuella lapsa]|uniref:tRNA_anti-like n=1 Tax=Snuella lapsa TaxID=870481 RepID=A0ABP6YI24_9FLAO
MRKWIILFIIIIVAVIGYNYVYQDHRDIKAEVPAYVISSATLINEFVDNSIDSEKKYLNKTVEVSGNVSEINSNDLTISDGIFCLFNTPVDKATIQIGSQIKIKGRVIGYDDLLEQIKLDQCSILTN